jgi:hypothetical protein
MSDIPSDLVIVSVPNRAFAMRFVIAWRRLWA